MTNEPADYEFVGSGQSLTRGGGQTVCNYNIVVHSSFWLIDKLVYIRKAGEEKDIT